MIMILICRAIFKIARAVSMTYHVGVACRAKEFGSLQSCEAQSI